MIGISTYGAMHGQKEKAILVLAGMAWGMGDDRRNAGMSVKIGCGMPVAFVREETRSVCP